MKLALLTAALSVCATPAFAQTAPAAQSAPTAPAPAASAAKFNLDTPIEMLMADPKAKAVIDTHMPGIAMHPAYEQFKMMSLRAVQPYSQGKLTDELMAKIEADLAAIK